MLIAIEGVKYEVDNLACDTLRVYGIEAIHRMQSIFNVNREVPAQIAESNSKGRVIRIINIPCISFTESYIDIVINRIR